MAHLQRLMRVRGNVIVGAGNVTTGLSGMQIDFSSLASDTGQIKIISVFRTS